MDVEDQENGPSVSRLREELKQWEKSFAAAHAGRKPGREDIKQDATIAAKYKTYERRRRGLTSVDSSEHVDSHRKERHDDNTLHERPANAPVTTPRRPTRISASHLLSPAQDSVAPAPDPTPAFIRSALGPTPQKDGQVLGIFDLMSCGSNTPSKSSERARPTAPCSTTTPSRKTPSLLEDGYSPAGRKPTSRTPQSPGQKFYLQAFAGTPVRKRKRDEDEEGMVEVESHTPEGRKPAPHEADTPAFLHRSYPPVCLPETKAQAPPFKTRVGGVIRSLSSIIQNLRKQEEKRMEDEWNVLNEIESEQQQQQQQPPPPQKPPTTSAPAMADSQPAPEVEMPLGPDRRSSDDEDGGRDTNTEPARKPWKKKGLKRQTRRVIMRPAPSKPSTAGGLCRIAKDAEAEDSEDGGPPEPHPREGAVDGDRTGPATEQPPPDKQTKRRTKVNVLAHTNFRRLNIKNKNSKARGRKGRR